MIEAAGGLLWRDGPSGTQIAVVYRSRYGDWTLPKGKLKRGEPWHQAALREVKEETGCDAALGEFAGSVSYLVDGSPKIVLYWHMHLEGECEFEPSEEVQKVVWLSPVEALQRLDYRAERQLLKEAQRPGTGS